MAKKTQIQPSKNTNRIVFLDLLKIIAIGLMIYDHVIKFLLNNFDYRLNLELYSIFILTPFSSALFLFITGWLLQYRVGNNLHSRKYLRKRIIGGCVLILISYVLWILTINQGTLASTGILQTLGVLWIIGALFSTFVPRNYQSLSLIFGMGLILISHWYLHQLQVFIPFINIMSFSLLPHSIYFVAGMWLAQEGVRRIIDKYNNIIRIIMGIMLVLSNFVLERNILVELVEIPVMFGYWSPSLLLIFYTLLILCLAATFIYPRPARGSISWESRFVGTLAKLALPIYIGHLVGLRVVEQFI